MLPAAPGPRRDAALLDAHDVGDHVVEIRPADEAGRHRKLAVLLSRKLDTDVAVACELVKYRTGIGQTIPGTDPSADSLECAQGL